MRASGLEILFEKGEIINGWFNFFASQSFLMKYALADGTVLFDNPVKLSSFTTSQRVALLSRPNDYYIDRNGGWSTPEHETEYHDILYGFFGPAALIASKKVCFEGENGISYFSKIAAQSNGSSPISYSTSTMANIHPTGGLNSFNNSVSCTTANVLSADRYTSDIIYVGKNQLDGKGNDNAVSMSGAFTHLALGASGDITKAAYNSSADLTVKALPGLLSNLATSMFDNIKVYKKANSNNGGFDHVRCNATSLSTEGFSEITGLTVSVSTDTASVNLASNVLSNDGVIICPTKNSALQGYGGIYLGGVQFAYLSIGAIPDFSGLSPVKIITITNIGNSTATGMSGVVSGALYTFTNGGYPGLSGTCGTSLAAGSSCAVNVTYTPSGPSTMVLTMTYNVAGNSVATKTKSVNGLP